MGRRREATGPALAGAGAPAAYFGRVSGAVNEWAERQQKLEEQRHLSARLKRGSEPLKIVDWFSDFTQSLHGPRAPSVQ
jgi:penicillin-binding protein 1A